MGALWVAKGPAFQNHNENAQTDLNFRCTQMPSCTLCWIPVLILMDVLLPNEELLAIKQLDMYSVLHL